MTFISQEQAERVAKRWEVVDKLCEQYPELRTELDCQKASQQVWIDCCERYKTKNKELKDRIEELSSKESSQRTIIEKALNKINAWLPLLKTCPDYYNDDTSTGQILQQFYGEFNDEILKILGGQEGTKKEDKK